MTAGITKVVLIDGLLPTQWMEGEERGAFWGISHPDETVKQLEAFHDHVAVLTTRDGVADSIDYFHSKNEANRAAGLPIYYGMFTDDGNRAVGLMVCCAIEGVEQGRERSLVVALLCDSITAIEHTYPEVYDTAVREHIWSALANVFMTHYGLAITSDETRLVMRTAKAKGGA